jgi:hypothetical protein
VQALEVAGVVAMLVIRQLVVRWIGLMVLVVLARLTLEVLGLMM